MQKEKEKKCYGKKNLCSNSHTVLHIFNKRSQWVLKLQTTCKHNLNILKAFWLTAQYSGEVLVLSNINSMDKW